MKRIKLTQGKFAIVSDKDYEKLSVFKWYFSNGYAVRDVWINGKSKTIFMHREIMNTPKGMDTDHINRNRSDNRSTNLRICTRSENRMNVSERSDNTSGIKGVYWHEKCKNWRVQICFNGCRKHIGYFNDKIKAIKAYNNAATKYFGEFAYLNNIN